MRDLEDAGPDAGDAGPDAGDAGHVLDVCTIGGTTYASRTLNPADRTLCCNPLADAEGWTHTLIESGTYDIPTQFDLSAGDFDGDGVADIALCVNDAEEIVLGNRNGGFGAPVSSPANITGCGSGAGDLDKDGKTDVVLATGDHVAVLMSLGGGRLGSETDYLMDGNIARVAVGDFDGDGWPDVAAADCAGTVTLLHNLATGDGSLGKPTVLSSFVYGGGTCQLRAGDFDGDGTLDFALTDVGDGWVAVSLNRGDGSFENPVASTKVPSPWALWAGRLVVARDEIVVGTQNGPDTYVVHQGLGQFDSVDRYETDVYQGELSVADFDGDGHGDLLAGGQQSLVILYNQGDGSLYPKAVAASWPDPQYLQSMAVGDFNGDGAPDVAVIYQYNLLELWLNGCP
jgi:hypothetical protein